MHKLGVVQGRDVRPSALRARDRKAHVLEGGVDADDAVDVDSHGGRASSRL